ncbi:hypothetical protein HYH02_012857 [Chlamydomonas schloesseri]|uniref:ACT domain-containing protein n=1 Tax=Chlamydomonas schloesseri TaxID=2026947 RepID=A0A835SZ45_9CHLO|nr:hypothetical protein HYH02_012857 [Chlamydomonas schloesseri]|eukprot:KAG2432723.1 hypothetical protein HYH02_012857 [Chlamydomonas schloesseri]
MAATLFSTASSRIVTLRKDVSSSVRPVAVIARPSTRVARACPLAAVSSSRRPQLVCRAAGAVAGAIPTVKIDNVVDPFATVLTVEFGEKNVELLDAVSALKNLGLNIRRATIGDGSTVFYITDADTSEKVVKSARLEDIRMTVLNSLVDKFPEVGEAFASGSKTDSEPNKVLGTRRRVVQTTIDVAEAKNGVCSLLRIVTSDRPGLLVDIVRVLKDINLNVVSAEIETEGALAKDEFFITYHGEPLNPPMVTLVTNALQYYLSLGELSSNESY